MDMTANDVIVELERYFQQTYVECVDREVRPLGASVIQYAIEAIREREKQSEGCIFCHTVYAKEDWMEGGAHDFRLHEGALYYCDYHFGWEGMEIQYCPMCGRKLIGEE